MSTAEEALKKIEETSREVGGSLELCSFKKGLRAAMNLAQIGNVYFDKTQAWTLVKTDKERCGTVLHVCLRLVQALGVFMAPYLPFSSESICKMLGYDQQLSSWDDATKELKEGKTVNVDKKVKTGDVLWTSGESGASHFKAECIHW